MQTRGRGHVPVGVVHALHQVAGELFDVVDGTGRLVVLLQAQRRPQTRDRGLLTAETLPTDHANWASAMRGALAPLSDAPVLAELRLERSLAALSLELDIRAYALEALLREGLELAGFDETLVYIQVTRGVAPRHHEFPAAPVPATRSTAPFPATILRMQWLNVSVKTRLPSASKSIPSG